MPSTRPGLPHERCALAWSGEPITDWQPIGARTIIVPPGSTEPPPGIHAIIHAIPRLAFAQIATRDYPPHPPHIHIGTDCRIHTTAVLGSEGFGYEWDGEQWLPFPHYDDVLIGNEVHIGAHTCIDRGALKPTIISSGARIDNLVHIAHGAFIGTDTLIAAGTVVEGSAHIGSCVTIGTNATIMHGRRVGDGCTIGSHANVTRDVPPGTVVKGNPAR